jgi:hypothetical protein
MENLIELQSVTYLGMNSTARAMVVVPDTIPKPEREGA